MKKSDSDIIWHNYNMSDIRAITKAVKNLEKIIRLSFEYDDWQRRCKYNNAVDCPVCGDNYTNTNQKCETHHHPKTLYSIVEEIINTHILNDTLSDKSCLDIVYETLVLHDRGGVSYINLCKPCHVKYHSDHPIVVDKINEIFNNIAKAGEKIINSEETINIDQIEVV